MKIVLKTSNGYINSKNLKIGRIEYASIFNSIAEALHERDRIYFIKPMIGRITTEVIR